MLYLEDEQQPRFLVIEQPSFLSWYGYFGLIAISDTFIFYDDVQFERRSWQTRNRITNKAEEWSYINVPVQKSKRDDLIKDIKISYENPWREKLLAQLQSEYGSEPYYDEYIDVIKQIFYKDYIYLADLNIDLIKEICKIIGFKMPKFLRSSDIDGIHGRKTERLVNITDKLGEKKYLSLTGAKGYIIPELFTQKGQELYWYEFPPEIYDQKRNEFISHMSVLDLLFRFGPTKTKDYILEIATKSISKG